MIEQVEFAKCGEWKVIDVGNGPPIVFIHGYPLDHRLWLSQVHAFRSSHRVIVPDLPGFGGTPAMQQSMLTMAELADQLSTLIKQLKVSTPVTIAGLSLGGYIALEFCRRHRSQVKQVAFCDSRVVADNDAQRAQRLQTAESVFQTGMEPIIEAMLPKLMAKASLQSHDLVEEVKGMMRGASALGVAAILRGMASRQDFSKLISEFDMPFLCIVGEEDVISPPTEMQQIADTIPNASCEVIAKAGHLSPLEQPEAFNHALMRWL